MRTFYMITQTFYPFMILVEIVIFISEIKNIQRAIENDSVDNYGQSYIDKALRFSKFSGAFLWLNTYR